LCEVAERKGWEIVNQYVDNGISGAKGREKRPEFDRLLKDATRRRFDVLMAWSVDRLGRSLRDLVAFLGEIHANGVDLYLHVQGVDTTTPAGRALSCSPSSSARSSRSASMPGSPVRAPKV
jgi:DNA invertase Pin-like site-specific DNA recombinase